MLYLYLYFIKHALNFCDHIVSVLDEYNEYGALMDLYLQGNAEVQGERPAQTQNGFTTNLVPEICVPLFIKQ
jgi:hypothetical protein